MKSDDDLVVGQLVIPADDLEERFHTSGGPGGQHANRSETAVTLRLDIEASSLPQHVKSRLAARFGPRVEATSADQRSQLRNRETARSRLADQIRLAIEEPKPRRETKPTKSSTERRLADKKARGQTKRQRQKPDVDD